MKAVHTKNRPMNTARRQIAVLLTTVACLCGAVTTQAAEMLHWKDVWVRSMPPGTQVTAAYGELMNHGDQTITISKLTADLGSEAQMHDVIAEGDQRRMVQLEEANIAPGASLVFEPGGRHIMIIGVGESPAEGSQVDICALSAAGTRACTQALVSRQAPGEQDSHDHHGAHSAHHADESPAKGSHHAEGSDHTEGSGHTDAEPAGHSGHHH